MIDDGLMDDDEVEEEEQEEDDILKNSHIFKFVGKLNILALTVSLSLGNYSFNLGNFEEFSHISICW